jgi:hypothetical protein
MKVRGGYGIVGLLLVLFVAVAILPILRRTFARSFPEGFQSAMSGGSGIDARTSLDCKGVNCQEGEFCQDNVCHPVYPAITNKYFPDK